MKDVSSSWGRVDLQDINKLTDEQVDVILAKLGTTSQVTQLQFGDPTDKVLDFLVPNQTIEKVSFFVSSMSAYNKILEKLSDNKFICDVYISGYSPSKEDTLEVLNAIECFLINNRTVMFLSFRAIAVDSDYLDAWLIPILSIIENNTDLRCIKFGVDVGRKYKTPKTQITVEHGSVE